MGAVFAYLRVSTDAQDVANQKLGVAQYCRERAWLPSFVEDTASGRLAWQKRPLGQLLRQMQAGDVLVVSEVSRLARSVMQVLEIAKEAVERDLRIHVVKSGMVFDDSMQSKILATILGLVAEIERDFISTRTREALAKKKAEGKTLGRPPGPAPRLKLDAQTEALDQMLRDKLPKAEMARRLHCSRVTLLGWLKLRRPDGKPARRKPQRKAA
jgi:DNA invertase Pin-like site-specific DNA recombinase